MLPVRCPACERGILGTPDSEAPEQTVPCGACFAAFPVSFGVVDLRGVLGKPLTCWDDARTVAEPQLEARLRERFVEADTREMGRIYADGFALPPVLARGLEDYLARSGSREHWPVRHMDNSARRLAGRPLGGRAVLEAGCGSGGSLPHLAKHYHEVAGQDTDMGALLLAARRAREAGLAGRVTLVAAPLEWRAFPVDAFDLIKCTDVIEHVDDPQIVALNLTRQLAPGGLLYMLTPNRWSLTTPEPHVRLWLVPFMPRGMANAYVRWRTGLRYEHVAHLLSARGVRALLEGCPGLRLLWIPIEDKHLNPDSPRGRRLRRLFRAPPLRWLSSAVRPVQPVLEALCVKEAGP